MINESKEKLIEHINAIENERNKYLIILEEIHNYFDNKDVLTEEENFLLEKIDINCGF